jgi:hypothetical protein
MARVRSQVQPSLFPKKARRGYSLGTPLQEAWPNHAPPTRAGFRPWPILWGLTLLFVILGLSLWDAQVQHVISIRADDVSQSGLAYAQMIQRHCQEQARNLKDGDWMVNISFADRPTVTRDEIVHPLQILEQCQPQRVVIPPGVGKRPGTSANQLASQILTIIAAKRTQGISFPAIVTIWLQAAEPVPDQPQFDLAKFQRDIKKITDQHSIVAIIGASGQLQTDLQETLKDSPHTRVCPMDSSHSCIDWAYDIGRTLPSAGERTP